MVRCLNSANVFYTLSAECAKLKRYVCQRGYTSGKERWCRPIWSAPSFFDGALAKEIPSSTGGGKRELKVYTGKAPRCYSGRGLATAAKRTVGKVMKDDVQSLSHSKWGMQVPHSVCAEISEADNIWEGKSRCRENIKRAE